MCLSLGYPIPPSLDIPGIMAISWGYTMVYPNVHRAAQTSADSWGGLFVDTIPFEVDRVI
jgi:hypothetical protein